MVALGIDISALSNAELKRLLEVARARQQTDLADKLIRELEGRSGPVGGWGGSYTPPHAPAGRASWAQEPAEPGPTSWRSVAAGVVAAAAASIGVGWWLLSPTESPVDRPAQVAQSAPAPSSSLPGAEVISPPAEPPFGPLAPRAPPPSQVAPTAPVAKPPAPSNAASARPARRLTAQKSQPAHRAKVQAAKRARAARPANLCRSPTTRADRLVCARPALARQDRALRQAYDRAVAAGVNRTILDRGQARWRQARSSAATAQQLSRVYARRIAELNAAARHGKRSRR